MLCTLETDAEITPARRQTNTNRQTHEQRREIDQLRHTRHETQERTGSNNEETYIISLKIRIGSSKEQSSENIRKSIKCSHNKSGVTLKRKKERKREEDDEVGGTSLRIE
jgi:hypothetical protein